MAGREHSGYDGSRERSGFSFGGDDGAWGGGNDNMSSEPRGASDPGFGRGPSMPGFGGIFGGPIFTSGPSPYRRPRRRGGLNINIGGFGLGFPTQTSRRSSMGGLGTIFGDMNSTSQGPFGPAPTASPTGPSGPTGTYPINSIPTGSGPGKQPKKSGLGWGILAIIVVIGLFFLLFAGSGGSSTNSSNDKSVAVSTTNRDRLDSGIAYDDNCVEDNADLFSSPSAAKNAGSSLRHFYDETGIQPFILTEPYDSSLTSNTAKDDWADEWYEDHIDNEATLLFVAFAGKSNTAQPYFTLIKGRQTTAVMDSEATQIFWDYFQKNWTTNRGGEAIVNTFNDTADRIMKKTTTKYDVQKWIIIAVVILIIGAIVIAFIIIRNKRKKEHEEYVERMVNTPVDQMDDPLLKKYGVDDDSSTNSSNSTTTQS